MSAFIIEATSNLSTSGRLSSLDFHFLATPLRYHNSTQYQVEELPKFFLIYFGIDLAKPDASPYGLIFNLILSRFADIFT